MDKRKFYQEIGIRHSKKHTGDIILCLCDNYLCIELKGINKNGNSLEKVHIDIEENSFNQFFKVLTLMFPNSEIECKEKEISCTPINNKKE